MINKEIDSSQFYWKIDRIMNDYWYRTKLQKQTIFLFGFFLGSILSGLIYLIFG